MAKAGDPGTGLDRREATNSLSGYLLLLAGGVYLVGSSASLLLPQVAAQIRTVTTILVIAEVPIVFWLLIWGARPQVVETPRG